LGVRQIIKRKYNNQGEKYNYYQRSTDGVEKELPWSSVVLVAAIIWMRQASKLCTMLSFNDEKKHSRLRFESHIKNSVQEAPFSTTMTCNQLYYSMNHQLRF